MERIARWESRGGASFVDLFRHEDGSYTFKAVDAGGCLGTFPDTGDEGAIRAMQSKVHYYQPDANKTPMKRTA